MNTFANIKIAATFNKVTYYTVKFEDETLSEFEKFVHTHQDNATIHIEYHSLMSLIKKLGNETGAKSKYFSRNEQRAEALPPQQGVFTSSERRIFVTQNHNLRLYCMRISDEVVFLFNGGVKTPGHITAQQCKVVRGFFKMANDLAKSIDEAIIDREIRISGLKIEFDTEFELTL